MGAERGGSASSPKERDKKDILSCAVREERISSLKKKKKKKGKVDLTHSNLHISQLVNEVFHYPAKDEAGKAGGGRMGCGGGGKRCKVTFLCSARMCNYCML